MTLPRARFALTLCFLLVADGGLAQTFVRVRNTGPHVEDSYRSFSGAWGDHDADGDLDLLAGSDEGLFFYRNDGAEIFSEITDPPADQGPGIPRAAIFGDYDNDGDLDVLRATFGDIDSSGALVNPLPNPLFRNDGATFAPETTSGDSTTTSSATFVDWENDGDLDLFLPGGHGTLDLFYRNDPTGFVQQTDLPFINTTSIGALESWIDVDADGDQDLYMTNHAQPNELWINQFVETGTVGSFAQNTTSGLTDEMNVLDFGMSWGDYDNDGDFDAFLATVVNDRFFRNEGDGTFTRILGIPLVQGTVTSSCGAWGDYDNDGDLDLFTPHAPGLPTGSDLWRNDGGTFVAMTAADVGEIVETIPNPQAAEWADYDNDGDLDLYTVTFGVTAGPRRNFMFRNEGGTNHWLEVDLVGDVSNRSGAGATIRVWATIGGQPVAQMRRVSAGPTAFEFQGPLRQHFGLGDATTIDSLRVVWPSGIDQTLTAVPADQILTVSESDVVGVTEEVHSEPLRLGMGIPNPFRHEVSLALGALGALGAFEIAVFDVQGRRVRTLAAGSGAGGRRVIWDGTTETGNPANAGVYFIRLREGSRVEERRIVRLR